MTLDEAIEHAKEVARTCDDSQCAADHMQLAEWLRQARGAERAARWYTEKIRELEEERDMYRDLVDCMVHPDVCDQLQAENNKLRKLASDLMTCSRTGDCLTCEHGRICDLRLDERCRGLGIEVER